MWGILKIIHEGTTKVNREMLDIFTQSNNWEVLLVKGLKHNLINISQLYDKGNIVTLIFLDAESSN